MQQTASTLEDNTTRMFNDATESRGSQQISSTEQTSMFVSANQTQLGENHADSNRDLLPKTQAMT